MFTAVVDTLCGLVAGAFYNSHTRPWYKHVQQGHGPEMLGLVNNSASSRCSVSAVGASTTDWTEFPKSTVLSANTVTVTIVTHALVSAASCRRCAEVPLEPETAVTVTWSASRHATHNVSLGPTAPASETHARTRTVQITCRRNNHKYMQQGKAHPLNRPVCVCVHQPEGMPSWSATVVVTPLMVAAVTYVGGMPASETLNDV